MRITTPGAVLLDWRPEDAPSLARHGDSPGIAATMRDGFPVPYTLEDAHAFIGAATGPGGHLYLAIELDGEAVGGIGVRPLGDVYCRTAEIGYWLSASCRGRGIATDAVRALVPVAFRRFEILRLQAGVFSNNPASMRVLEKAGFVREAVHERAIWKNGQVLDEVLYVRFAPGAGP
ncbi:MAG: GNAT family N-acetyltransferase [Methanospirillum sp.]|nr:GNAT family N-acetyltransferase [Methanospirillum sp.]